MEESDEFMLDISLSKNEKKMIILSMMSMKVDLIQIRHLQKYTKSQIRNFLKKFLYIGSDDKLTSKDTNIENKFLLEEIYWYKLFSKIYPKDHNEIFFECDTRIRPICSIHSSRVVLGLDNNDISEISKKLSEKILDEKIFYNSLCLTDEMKEKNLTCEMFVPYRSKTIMCDDIDELTSEKAEEEIRGLISNIDILTANYFMNDRTCLAVFRGINYEFPMCKEAVMIGKPSDDGEIDVDLTLESTYNSLDLKHYAVVSFLPDFRFYLENVSQALIRVNGVVLRYGQICIIPNGAILDFSDSLLTFLHNVRFIDEIKEFCSNC